MKNDMEAFSEKWFVIYYAVFGLLLLVGGGWLLIVPDRFQVYLIRYSDNEKPPRLIRTILKYWLLFTIPCLILSFFPFSWPELLFSVWSLLMIYISGSQLLRWPQLRVLIQDHSSKLSAIVRWLGVSMMSAAIVILLLGYMKVLTIIN